jgi:glucose dehydrogenase
VLYDVVVDGRRVRALAQPTKQAFLFVLNRETGKPIWPIEERAVPQSTVRTNDQPHAAVSNQAAAVRSARCVGR